jgi:AraC-like DNA-binding protein
MKKNSISFIRNIEQKGEFHEEDITLSTLPCHSQTSFIDIYCFGYSFFKRGAVLPIKAATWVIQLQTEGNARVETDDGSFNISSGNLLVVPPNFRHTYRVPKNNDMRKIFIIFRSGPLLDILLGEEIRSNGILIRDSGLDSIKFFEELHENMKSASPDSLENLSTDLYRLLFRIRSLIVSKTPMGDFETSLRAAVRDISRDISLDSLAESFGLGKHSLIREFHRQTGCSPVKFMISMRMRQAEQLLTLSSMPIAEIASVCGYSSPSFFSSEFKKHFGITPNGMRKKRQNTDTRKH